jgi:hypothetical protein
LDGSEAQLDATLVEDKSEDEESSDESDPEDESSAAPTIELKVSLGRLDENPAIAMLAGDSDDEDANEKEIDDSSEDVKRSNLKVVSETIKKDETNPSSTKKRKVLIQELS